MPSWQHKIEVFQMAGTAPDARGIADRRAKLVERLDAIGAGGWELVHYTVVENAERAQIFTIWKRPVP